MDKDDPFNRPANPQGGGENDFEDDARYDDAITPSVREEEYAAGQEEWDQPIDELAEDDQHMEAQPQPRKDPFAADDEGPLEDDYSEHTHEAHEHEGAHDIEHEDGELEHDPETEGPEMQAPPRAAAAKSPSNIMKYVPYAGGAIAVLVAGFFGYQMLMGGSSNAPTQPSLENQNTWDLQPTQPAPTQQASNEFQQPAPTQVQPDLNANNTQPAPTSSGSNVITPVQQPQQAPLPVATAPNPLESRVAELTAQLEQMKHTQDDLTQKLQAAQQAAQQAQQAAQQPPSMDENSKAATAALNARIAELEQKLATASTGAQTTTTTTTQSVDAPVSKAAARKAARDAARAARQAAADAAPAETTTRKSKHAASTDFMAAKKSKAAKKRKAAAEPNDDTGFEPVARSSFQGWILRSAQPGSAWLSQGPYSSDLRRVVPGDKVQGLGTVTSIHQIAGRWVVEGTQGAVR